MRRGINAFTALVSGLALSAAIAPVVACAQAGPLAPADLPPRSADADYKLGTGDKLRVIVFGEAALSGDFLISDTGQVAFPLVGDVHAEGLSVQQFQDLLRAKLAEGYLKDPRVSAEVENYRPFYILGEVQKPGEYPYTTGLTVMNAVATAGGFTYRANTRNVSIRRSGATKEAPTRLTAVTPVGPGDTIVIKERLF